jgi:hypothetical protein
MRGATAISAVTAWAALVVVPVTACVTAYDVWAWKAGHRMMATQYQDWLHQEVAGPIIIGLFVGLTFHFLVRVAR